MSKQSKSIGSIASQTVSGKASVDVKELCRQIATRKTGCGESFVAKDLLKSVLVTIRSMRGLAHDASLPSKEFEEIRRDVDGFWAGLAMRMIANYQITAARFDAPTVAIEDSKVNWVTSKYNASIRGWREIPTAERKLACTFALSAAERRLAAIRENPARYTRDDSDKAVARIKALEREHTALENAKGK